MTRQEKLIIKGKRLDYDEFEAIRKGLPLSLEGGTVMGGYTWFYKSTPIIQDYGGKRLDSKVCLEDVIEMIKSNYTEQVEHFRKVMAKEHRDNPIGALLVDGSFETEGD